MGKKVPVAKARAARTPSTNGTGQQDRAIRELTDVFKSLSDPHRLKILFLLSSNGEMHVSSISDELGQSQPAVSHHLTQLRSAGLIDYRREGKFNYYSLSPDGLAELYDELFPSGIAPKLIVGGVELSIKWKG